jgi:hypothetical protein
MAQYYTVSIVLMSVIAVAMASGDEAYAKVRNLSLSQKYYRDDGCDVLLYIIKKVI